MSRLLCVVITAVTAPSDESSTCIESDFIKNFIVYKNYLLP